MYLQYAIGAAIAVLVAWLGWQAWKQWRPKSPPTQADIDAIIKNANTDHSAADDLIADLAAWVRVDGIDAVHEDSDARAAMDVILHTIVRGEVPDGE